MADTLKLTETATCALEAHVTPSGKLSLGGMIRYQDKVHRFRKSSARGAYHYLVVVVSMISKGGELVPFVRIVKGTGTESVARRAYDRMTFVHCGEGSHVMLLVNRGPAYRLSSSTAFVYRPDYTKVV